jgi:uncharacterized protein (DUF488 family)
MMTKEEVKAIVNEVMTEKENETHKLKCKVVDHLAQEMGIEDLKLLAVKEAGEIIQHYAMGHLEDMLKSYVELKIAMKAVCKHLPAGMTERVYRETVENYAKTFHVM